MNGRVYADGRPQSKQSKKEYAVSPTVYMEALEESLMINAAENLDITIFDVPGPYLWDDMRKGKTVLVKFEGEFVDIICDIDLTLLIYIIHEQGNKLLSLKLDKALFGFIDSTILCYNINTTTLKTGFKGQPLRKICITQNCG